MINTETTDTEPERQDAAIETIVASGPHGAVVVAGIATFIVVGLWILFYWLVFLPRGATP